MPPARRQLRALGSLQLLGHANHPSKIITELAFITDKHVNARAEVDHDGADSLIEVQFNEFLEGVNSRGIGTKTRQKKMTAEQAAAILLVTVQKGHVELIADANDPCIIDMIRILPGARRILATFLPKLRGYGDLPYEHQYKGAIALAKRHFFPNGKAPTKKELMALLLQSYQQRRTRSRPQATQIVQTSMSSIDGSSETRKSNESAPCVCPTACSNTVKVSGQSKSESKVQQSNTSVVVDVEPTRAFSEIDARLNDSDDDDVFSNLGVQPNQFVTATPYVAARVFNPYMTPMSNPRRVCQIEATARLDVSPTPAISTDTETTRDEGHLAEEDVRESLQTTATYQGRLNYYYNKFISACQEITSLKKEKEEIQKKYNFTQRKLDETEKNFRDTDADRSKWKQISAQLQRMVNAFIGQVNGLVEAAISSE